MRGGSQASLSSTYLCASVEGSGAIRSHQKPPEGNWKPSGAIRSHLKPSEGIRSHRRPSEAIRGHQKSSEAIGSHQKHLRVHGDLGDVRRAAEHEHVALAVFVPAHTGGHGRSREVIWRSWEMTWELAALVLHLHRLHQLEREASRRHALQDDGAELLVAALTGGRGRSQEVVWEIAGGHGRSREVPVR